MLIQRQVWNNKLRYLIVDEYGSVMLDLYDELQQWGEHYGTALIWGLYVYPNYRRKGHARQLLEKAEFYAAKEGYKDVFLQWVKRNTPYEILEFYKQQGYCEIDVDDKRTDIMLRKELKEEDNTKELNLYEMLKNHEGEIFYLTTVGNVLLKGINPKIENGISLVSTNIPDYNVCLNKNGAACKFGECILFISKENKNWGTWKI